MTYALFEGSFYVNSCGNGDTLSFHDWCCRKRTSPIGCSSCVVEKLGFFYKGGISDHIASGTFLVLANEEEI